MTRKNKLIILIIYLFALSLALPLYLTKRNKADKRLKADIQALEQDQAKIKAGVYEVAQLRMQFRGEAGTAQFVESLYAAAKEAKLTAHEVSTEGGSAAKRSASRGGKTDGDDLQSERVKIHVEGAFRAIAEYVRLLQNTERFKRIKELKLAPGKQAITGDIVIELYSIKGNHGI